MYEAIMVGRYRFSYDKNENDYIVRCEAILDISVAAYVCVAQLLMARLYGGFMIATRFETSLRTDELRSRERKKTTR